MYRTLWTNWEHVDLSKTLKPRWLDVDEFLILQKHKKDERIAKEKREEGNDFFIHEKYVKAMEKYNESLCFATSPRSISLAYANRAACFLHMGLCNECLTDIEWAKEAGYPKELMPKLEQRVAECMDIMPRKVLPKHYDARVISVKTSADLDAKLSYKSDKRFPCMADVLKIYKEKNGKFRVIATEDIDVNKTILVDEPFEKYLYQNYGRKCNICLKGNVNLRPCNSCSIALFCTNCSTNRLHEDECGISCHPSSLPNGDAMHMARSILMAFQLFPDIDDLIAFVEDTIQSDPKEIPPELIDANSKYRAFLKLPIKSEKMLEDVVLNFFMAFEVLKIMPKIKEKFKLQKHRNFVLHLLRHHAMIKKWNTHQKRPWWLTELEEMGIKWGIVPFFYGRTALMEPYFQRSCAPNTLYTDCDGNSVYITVRPIKKGEQILISALNFLDSRSLMHEVMESFAKDDLGDIEEACTCKRCQGVTATDQQKQLLQSDPDFGDIEDSYKGLFQNFDANVEKVRVVIGKCMAFLRKYSEVFWTYEIQRTIELFIHLTAILLVNPVQEEECYGAYYNL